VRIRLANLSMDSHPIHFHGHRFYITGTPGGPIHEAAWLPEATVNVPVGTTRDIEFYADNPGDWALHCHKAHHVMTQMGHGLPNLLGVDVGGMFTIVKIREELPPNGKDPGWYDNPSGTVAHRVGTGAPVEKPSHAGHEHER